MCLMLSSLLLVSMAGCENQALAQSGAEFAAVNDFDWRAHIQLSDVRATGFSGRDFGSPYYRDVMGHAVRKITGYSAMTNAHETNHMLSSEVRNATSDADNTVYLENGKAALVLEPKMSSTLIKTYVPPFIRSKSSRYQLYLVEQTAHWPEVLYQFDEWSAYRTDSRVAMEVDKAGQFDAAAQNEVCVMDGTIDFLYFASAAVHALRLNEPEYLRTNVQFKAAYAMLAEQSMEYYNYGRGNRNFDCNASIFVDHFVNSPDNDAIRATLRDWMGSGWTARVLGF